MSRRTGSKRVYGASPSNRIVYGLEAFRNDATGFVQDRVGTRSFDGRSYVYCNVGTAENRRLMIFGWLNDRESALLEAQVAVTTLSASERRNLRAHLFSSLTPPQAIDFW